MRAFLGFLFVLLLTGAAALYASAFIVHQNEQALVLRFGEPVNVITKPGLNWKVPVVDTVDIFDKRILEIDAEEPEEVITADRKRIVVDAFARYRIVDALKFYRAVATQSVAIQRLEPIMISSMRGVVGRQSFVDILSAERAKLMLAIRDQMRVQASGLGIEIVDVRIRRADLPKENLEAVFGRMQTERQREAAGIRAAGDEEAQGIRAEADKQVTIIKANATKKSEILRGEGDAERNKVLGDAYGRDAEFFEFYRTLRAYEQSMTGDNTTMVISPDSPFFKYFRQGQSGR